MVHKFKSIKWTQGDIPLVVRLEIPFHFSQSTSGTTVDHVTLSLLCHEKVEMTVRPTYIIRTLFIVFSFFY